MYILNQYSVLTHLKTFYKYVGRGMDKLMGI